MTVNTMVAILDQFLSQSHIAQDYFGCFFFVSWFFKFNLFAQTTDYPLPVEISPEL